MSLWPDVKGAQNIWPIQCTIVFLPSKCLVKLSTSSWILAHLGLYSLLHTKEVNGSL